MNELYTLANCLIKKLDRYGYSHFLRVFRNSEYFIYPWPNFQLIKNRALLIEGGLQPFILLFLAGMKIQIGKLKGIFTDEEFQAFIELGIFKVDAEYVRSTKALIPYMGNYLFADFPYFYPTNMADNANSVYLGDDSFLLASLLPNWRHKKVLDLCTGSGIQAIILGKRNDSVTGTDITPECIHIARLNAAINEVTDTVQFFNSDLFSSVNDTYDLIIANPPTQIIPENIDYPLIGNGGKDGLKIIKRIILELDEHLSDNGCFFTIAQLLGNDVEPFYLKELQEVSYKNKWSAKIIIHERMPLSEQANVMSKCSSSILNKAFEPDQWLKYYEENNLTYLYNVILQVHKTGEFQFESNVWNFWDLNDVPIKRVKEEYKSVERYVLNPTSRAVTAEERRFIELCNGSRSLLEITQCLNEEFGFALGRKRKIEAFCTWLQNNGLIYKRKVR